MCLTAIEGLFLIAGIWLLISGEAPNKLFRVMFGKGDYRLSPVQARVLGLLLASPLPILFCVSLTLGMLARANEGNPNLGLSLAVEIVYDLFVAIVAIIVARRSRQGPGGAAGDPG